MRKNPMEWAQHANQDNVKLRNYMNEKFKRLYRGIYSLPNGFTAQQSKEMAMHAIQGEMEILRHIMKDTYDVSQPSAGTELIGPATMALIDGGISTVNAYRHGSNAISY